MRIQLFRAVQRREKNSRGVRGHDPWKVLKNRRPYLDRLKMPFQLVVEVNQKMILTILLLLIGQTIFMFILKI